MEFTHGNQFEIPSLFHITGLLKWQRFREIRKKVFESGIKEVFRLMPNASETHRPATTCGAFARLPRCYLFHIARKNRRLETENA